MQFQTEPSNDCCVGTFGRFNPPYRHNPHYRASDFFASTLVARPGLLARRAEPPILVARDAPDSPPFEGDRGEICGGAPIRRGSAGESSPQCRLRLADVVIVTTQAVVSRRRRVMALCTAGLLDWCKLAGTYLMHQVWGLIGVKELRSKGRIDRAVVNLEHVTLDAGLILERGHVC